MAQKKTYTGKRSIQLPDYVVSNFSGLNTSIKDIKSLPKGVSPDSLNWITGRDGDHIELRRGQALLGQTRKTGTGRVSGLGIGVRYDGVQIPFYTYGRKLNYYNPTTDDTTEIGTDTLPVVASSDDVAIANYQGLAGSFIYASSKNSSIYKIPVANPGSVADQQSYTYKGKIKAGQGRLFLWDRLSAQGKDTTGLYLSYLDKSLLSGFTQINNETTPTTASKTYTGTLAFKAIDSRKTCMFVQIAAPIDAGLTIIGITAASSAVVTVAPHSFKVGDFCVIQGAGGMTQINNILTTVVAISGTTISLAIDSSAFSAWTSGGKIYTVEVATDDRNGNLSSPAGATGTINYATGAYSVTFFNQPTTSLNIDFSYFWELSVSGGVCDFSFSGSRTAGQGNTFRQDDGGGNLQAVWPINTVEYCFHILKTWQLNLTNTDTNATNLPYRSQVGIPYWLSAYPVNDGILYLDNTKPNQPVLRKLAVSIQDSTNIVPESISDVLDLSPYDPSTAVVFQWGDYDIVCLQNIRNGVADGFNGSMFVRNNLANRGYWDKLDYSVSALGIYNGSLLSGDSLSNNLMTLFSGFDDDGSVIPNQWTSGDSNNDVQGLKERIE